MALVLGRLRSRGDALARRGEAGRSGACSRMLRPQRGRDHRRRRSCSWRRPPRCSAGPLLVSYGIDNGIKKHDARRAEPRGASSTSRSRSSGSCSAGSRSSSSRASARASCATCATGSFGHLMGAVARLLRDREDRPDRRPHDLRHRRDAGAHLAGPRAVRAEHLLVHRRGRVHAHRCRGSSRSASS